MPAELGRVSPWKGDELQEQFKALWIAQPDKRQEAWSKLKDWRLAGATPVTSP